MTFEIDHPLGSSDEWQPVRPRSVPVGHLALVGNALPRKCGMATFTSHVADALRLRYPAMKLDHYAIDDGTGVEYPAEIRTIRADDPASYRDAAQRIERSGAEAIWLQHEYGIFGGEAGCHILELVGATKLPLVVTLHTVLEEPSDAEEAVLRRLLDRAEVIIVMADKGAEILRNRYGLPPGRALVIPHGVPDRPLRDARELKPMFGWQGRKVLMTFGLLAPDKGIMDMIEAMPAIVEAEPDVLYAIVGATHPVIVRHEGERHRERLQARAGELGVAGHIEFVDAFIEQEELLDMLQASDIYITPYLNMAQVTSGTLSYAVAVGKPVIATPYVHACEILADDHGVIVPREDPAALAEAAIRLLTDAERRDALARAAYRRGRSMLWSRVVEQALAPLGKASPQPPARYRSRRATLPIHAIQRMTDGVGMMQHSVYSIPDRNHGYCIDDNARALMLAVRDEPQFGGLTTTYAAFVEHGWNADLRRFRNFMGYDRTWLEPAGSDDSNGRALWALGCAAAHSRDTATRDWALARFGKYGVHLAELDSPRTRAFMALGGDALLDDRPRHALALDLIERSGEQLMALHSTASRPGWHWFEPVLAYDNARLCEALIRAGVRLDRPDMLDLGVSTLCWLIERQTGPRGQFRPVGCHGFARPYAPPLAFDQQPVEAWATIDACAAAFDATGEDRWHRHARHAFGWFFGDNDAGIPLADVNDGACFDGLMATGINRNQGAESILSLHLAAVTMRQAFGEANRTGQDSGTAAQGGASATSSKIHDSISASPAPA